MKFFGRATAHSGLRRATGLKYDRRTASAAISTRLIRHIFMPLPESVKTGMAIFGFPAARLLRVHFDGIRKSGNTSPSVRRLTVLPSTRSEKTGMEISGFLDSVPLPACYQKGNRVHSFFGTVYSHAGENKKGFSTDGCTHLLRMGMVHSGLAQQMV